MHRKPRSERAILSSEKFNPWFIYDDEAHHKISAVELVPAMVPSLHLLAFDFETI